MVGVVIRKRPRRHKGRDSVPKEATICLGSIGAEVEAMGKLVIRFEGKLVGEVNLKLGDMKIGRKADCDIILDDALVSGEHALVKTVGMKSNLHDLDSTNGTFIGDKRIKQHALRHGETIIIGGHSLIYREDVNLDAPTFGKRPAGRRWPTLCRHESTRSAGWRPPRDHRP